MRDEDGIDKKENTNVTPYTKICPQLAPDLIKIKY